jgi:hypothetical protein
MKLSKRFHHISPFFAPLNRNPKEGPSLISALPEKLEIRHINHLISQYRYNLLWRQNEKSHMICIHIWSITPSSNTELSKHVDDRTQLSFAIDGVHNAWVGSPSGSLSCMIRPTCSLMTRRRTVILLPPSCSE